MKYFIMVTKDDDTGITFRVFANQDDNAVIKGIVDVQAVHPEAGGFPFIDIRIGNHKISKAKAECMLHAARAMFHKEHQKKYDYTCSITVI